jgi:hypothetical protein
MDLACKQRWEQAVGQVPQHFPTETWSVWVEGTKITSNLRERICEVLGQRVAEEYWDGRVGTDHARQVDLVGYARASKEVPMSRRVWITKQASGIFGSGKMMMQTGDRVRAKCPFCEEPENSAHIWRCASADATRQWEQSVSKLAGWMQQQRTDPANIAAVVEHLTGWRANTTPNPGLMRVTQAILCQNVISWRSFLEG